MNIGFIGVGNMGRHMASNLIKAGYSVYINDLFKESAKPLLDKGAKWVDSPREVAVNCPTVITMLPTPPDVEKVVYGANGLMAGWKKGDIYIDMSTDSPTLLRRIDSDAKKKGVEVLDGPVSGGVGGAEAGTLAIMVGGSKETFEKSRKVLEAMGKNLFYVGDIGCGNVAKLVNNLISIAANTITAEGFVLGVKAGIDPIVLRDIVQVSTGANFTANGYVNTVLKGNFKPGFKLSLALKDIGLAVALGKELGVPMPVGAAAEMRLVEAKTKGLGDDHVDSVVQLLEEVTGVKVRAKNK
jgi:2-hydroxymethylglutarate dehydrogenase